MTTDTQLKIALAKMLPEDLMWTNYDDLKWIKNGNRFNTYGSVRDTELLHVCWLIEQTIDLKDKWRWLGLIDGDYAEKSHATWQQRATALAKVKGVEV